MGLTPDICGYIVENHVMLNKIQIFDLDLLVTFYEPGRQSRHVTNMAFYGNA